MPQVLAHEPTLMSQHGKGVMLAQLTENPQLSSKTMASSSVIICNTSDTCFLPDLAPVITWMHRPEISYRALTHAVSRVDFTVSSKILAHLLLGLHIGVPMNLPHLTGCFHKICGNFIVFGRFAPLSDWSNRLCRWTQLQKKGLLCLQNWAKYTCRFVPVLHIFFF